MTASATAETPGSTPLPSVAPATPGEETPMGLDEIPVPDVVLLYAFRYALGRNSGADRDVAAQLERHAAQLAPWMRQQIVQEIDRALAENRAGRWLDISDRWRLCRDRLAAHEGPAGVSR